MKFAATFYKKRRCAIIAIRKKQLTVRFTEEEYAALKGKCEIAHSVEKQLGCSLDTASYCYIRFLAHLRFLVRRLVKGSCTQTENSSLFMQAARDFPEAYQCAYAINRVFEKEFKQSCSDEELLYLMMHINRLRSASQTE